MGDNIPLARRCSRHAQLLQLRHIYLFTRQRCTWPSPRHNVLHVPHRSGLQTLHCSMSAGQARNYRHHNHLLLQHQLTAGSRHVLPLLLPHRARQPVLLQDALEHARSARRRRPELEIRAEHRVPRYEVDHDVAALQQLPQLVRVAVQAVEVGA